MSTLDLMEDGFPHGTREGYQKGCHSRGACLGPLDGLMTCVEANMRYASDYSYRKRVDAGETPQAIAEADTAGAPKPKKAKDAPGAVTAAESGEPIRENVVADPVPERPVPSPPPSPAFEVFPGPTEKVSVYAEHEERMRELHGQGLSDAAIAREIGKPQPGTSRYLRKLGLEGNGRSYPTVTAPEDAEPLEPEETVAEVSPGAILAEVPSVRACRRCGCTDEDCADCIAATGEPCSWVEGDLCSACDVPRLRTGISEAIAGLEAEKTARQTLLARTSELSQLRVDADEKREAAERRVGELTDQVAGLLLELDVAKSPDAVSSGAGLAVVPPAPVAAVMDEQQPVRAGAVGLDIQQVGEALSVRLHGGEPVHLNLSFVDGSLADVGVKIGA